jgi:hypothetical protein
MTRATAPALALAIAALAALALSACGSGSDAKLLPGKTAQEIGENLDSVQTLVDEGECVDAADAALEVSTEVEALQNIDPELKAILKKGADRLNEVVDLCEANLSEDTIEEAVPAPEFEDEDATKEKKPKKVEPENTQSDEQEETTKPPTEAEPPSQGNGEEKGHEEEAAPPAEEAPSGGPSGGIGPGAATGEG